MERTASLAFTGPELHQLAGALDAVAVDNHGFSRHGAVHDAAFTSVLLKVASARLALGDIKGLDLQLPPWAAAPILTALAPPAAVTVTEPVKPKRIKSRAPRRRRGDGRRRPSRRLVAPAPAARVLDAPAPDPVDLPEAV